jgi:hypothetical protein
VPHDQLDIFGAAPDPAPALPDGFRYAPDVLSPADERALVAAVGRSPSASSSSTATSAGGGSCRSAGGTTSRRGAPPGRSPAPVPPRRPRRAAAFAGVAPDHLAQALVTEYDAGAAIGWHRDKAVFGDVVGLSLLAPCTFRLRRAAPGGGWERRALVAEPRSAYLLRGPARAEWEHSIPAVPALRYSVTFRSLRARR